MVSARQIGGEHGSSIYDLLLYTVCLAPRHLTIHEHVEAAGARLTLVSSVIDARQAVIQTAVQHQSTKEVPVMPGFSMADIQHLPNPSQSSGTGSRCERSGRDSFDRKHHLASSLGCRRPYTPIIVLTQRPVD